MSTRAMPNLSNVGSFYYSADVNIQPVIPKVKHKGTFFDLMTTKDEDVQVVNGEIVVVTNEVTVLNARHDDAELQYVSGDEMLAEVKKIATLAKSNKASLNGTIILSDEEVESPYRIKIVDNVIEVVEGKVGIIWSDGTASSTPSGCNV